MVPNDDASEILRFKCKTCDKDVTYKREIVLGLHLSVDQEKEKVVYLTCPDGHVHPYIVKGG